MKDLRKPLTAFKSSAVMLDRDPERHVGLLPAQYSSFNDPESALSMTGLSSNMTKLAINAQYESHAPVNEPCDDRESLHSFHLRKAGIDPTMTAPVKKADHSLRQDMKAMMDTIGGGRIEDYLERKVYTGSCLQAEEVYSDCQPRARSQQGPKRRIARKMPNNTEASLPRARSSNRIPQPASTLLQEASLLRSVGSAQGGGRQRPE